MNTGISGLLSSLIWLLFLFATFLLPMLRQRRVTRSREEIVRDFERRRGSRLITLIHRQEALSFLGIPLARYINIEDSEQVLRAIRLTPPEMPIDLLLHTPGGLVLAAEQIARAIQKRPGKVTVLVPHYAMSGGTLLALAADEIVMDPNAVLGPVDPQIGNFPAASILKVKAEKPIAEMDDETLILADVASKALEQVRRSVFDLIRDRMPDNQAETIAQAFTEGRWTHDYPIDIDQLRSFGLTVNDDLPTEVYELMDLYPQPAGRRPSVGYIPIPYRQETPNRGR
ncbi:MAG: SDH family Clp fold serine proteinase [Bacillota bacterium]